MSAKSFIVFGEFFRVLADVAALGLVLILTGVVVVLAGVLKASVTGEGRVKGGAVVLVGPIPVAFGTDAKWTSVAIGLALVLMVLALLFYLGWP